MVIQGPKVGEEGMQDSSSNSGSSYKRQVKE